MDPSLGQLLKETGVHDIWVEFHPQFFQGDPSIFLKRLRELSENHCCFPIIGDIDLLAAILKDRSGIGRIVLKGCEASGFVSGETTMALYSMVKEVLRTSSNPRYPHLGRRLHPRSGSGIPVHRGHRDHFRERPLADKSCCH